MNPLMDIMKLFVPDEHPPRGIVTCIYTNNVLSGAELNRQVIAVSQAREYGALRKGLLDYHPSVFVYPRRTRIKMKGTLFDIYGQSLGDGKSILTSLKQNRSW